MGWLFKSAEEHNQAGLESLALGEVGDAIQHFNKAAKKEPSEPNYWWNLGIAKSHAGDTEGAIFALQYHADLGGEFAEEALQAVAELQAGSGFGIVGEILGGVAEGLAGAFFESLFD